MSHEKYIPTVSTGRNISTYLELCTFQSKSCFGCCLVLQIVCLSRNPTFANPSLKNAIQLQEWYIGALFWDIIDISYSIKFQAAVKIVFEIMWLNLKDQTNCTCPKCNALGKSVIAKKILLNWTEQCNSKRELVLISQMLPKVFFSQLYLPFSQDLWALILFLAPL